jgi:hypothetical protein
VLAIHLSETPPLFHPPVPSRENTPRKPSPPSFAPGPRPPSRRSFEYILSPNVRRASRVLAPTPNCQPTCDRGPSSLFPPTNPAIDRDAGRTVTQQYLNSGFDEFDSSPLTSACQRLSVIHTRLLQHNLSFAQDLIVLFQRHPVLYLIPAIFLCSVHRRHHVTSNTSRRSQDSITAATVAASVQELCATKA